MEANKNIDIEKRIREKAVDYQYENLPTAASSTVILSLLAVVVLWQQADHLILLVWAASGILIGLVRYILYVNYQQKKKRSLIDKPENWGDYFAFTSLAAGLYAGMAFMLFITENSFGSQVFLMALIIGIVAGASILNAYWLKSAYYLIIPAVSFAVIRTASEGGIEYIGLAILLLSYLLIMLKIAKNSNKAAHDSIRLQLENFDLYKDFQEQKELAEQANVAKSKFLAAASHDMRQPLHAMGLFASLLEKELNSDKQKNPFNNRTRSLDALRELLNTLLDVSKLDAGVVEKNLSDFYLSKIVGRLAVEFGSEAEEKNISFKFTSTDTVVHSDLTLLELMLRNLLSNAIKYTEKGGVEINVSETNGMVNISVIDTGVGIPANKQQEIFQEFIQLDNPERDRTKGLGLGLAIVKRLTGLLKNTIEIETNSVGGTTFTLTIPAGDKNNVKTEVIEQFVPNNSMLNNVPVVLIDDEAHIREGMKRTLEEWGCTVLIAGSEAEALDKIKLDDFRPKAIITDYRLRENKTGAQAIQAIRDVIGNEIPALIITGDTSPERLREARASGHALLHKPVQPAQILAFIRRVAV